MAQKGKKRNYLLGVGFDKNGRDQIRITQGENYNLFGGSKGTHEQMQEKAAKFNEELKRKHKTLDAISGEEFNEIAHKLDMPLIKEVRTPALHSRN